MGISLTIMAASGALILALSALFAHEKRRGARYGARVRAIFDRVLAHISSRILEPSARATGHALRQSVYYLFHRALTAFLHFISRLEERVRDVVRVNRERANRPRSERDQASHLALITEHKRTAGLSEEEKAVRRDDALSGG